MVTIKGDWEIADKRAYSVSKNIAKLFRRDIVPKKLRRKTKIIDLTSY